MEGVEMEKIYRFFFGCSFYYYYFFRRYKGEEEKDPPFHNVLCVAHWRFGCASD